jgi:hypothetical protein
MISIRLFVIVTIHRISHITSLRLSPDRKAAFTGRVRASASSTGRPKSGTASAATYKLLISNDPCVGINRAVP